MYNSTYDIPYSNQRIDLNRACKKLDKDLQDGSINIRTLKIPATNARLESNEKFRTMDDLDGVDCYTIYIPEFKYAPYTYHGDVKADKHNPNGHLIFFKFPKSQNVRSIILYSDGGVDFVQHEHKFILRESDELDRRIVAGFCKLYNMQIVEYCETGRVSNGLYGPWLEHEALTYNARKQPKRLKLGHSDRPMYESFMSYDINDFCDEAFIYDNMIEAIKFI